MSSSWRAEMRAAPVERYTLWPATVEQIYELFLRSRDASCSWSKATVTCYCRAYIWALPEEQRCELLLKNGYYGLLLKSKDELFLKNRDASCSWRMASMTCCWRVRGELFTKSRDASCSWRTDWTLTAIWPATEEQAEQPLWPASEEQAEQPLWSATEEQAEQPLWSATEEQAEQPFWSATEEQAVQPLWSATEEQAEQPLYNLLLKSKELNCFWRTEIRAALKEHQKCFWEA